MEYTEITVTLVALGTAFTIYKLMSIDPAKYHVVRFKGLVDKSVYGGAATLNVLELRVPLLYLQCQRKGDRDHLYLNVLVPLEGAYVIHETKEVYDPETRVVRIIYTAEMDDTGETERRLFHHTLIPIDAGVGRVEVVCVKGNESGGSGIGTGDSDTEDPISVGAATPYMSANASLGYNGGDSATTTVFLRADGTRHEMTLSAGHDIQLVESGQPLASVAVGERRVKNVTAVS